MGKVGLTIHTYNIFNYSHKVKTYSQNESVLSFIISARVPMQRKKKNHCLRTSTLYLSQYFYMLTPEVNFMEALHVTQLTFTINTNLKCVLHCGCLQPQHLRGQGRQVDASLESVYFRVRFVSKQNRKISSNVFLTYLALYNTNLIKSSKTGKKNF